MTETTYTMPKSHKWRERMEKVGVLGLVLCGLAFVAGIGVLAVYGVVNMTVSAFSADVNIWPHLWDDMLRYALLAFPTLIVGGVIAALGFGIAKLIEELWQ